MRRFNINHQIRSREVVIIDEAGANLGVRPLAQALQMAAEQDMDLIEVSPLAVPPVCRIMNYGKWQYRQSQKVKKQKILDTKIVRLSFKIGDHDRAIRLAQVQKFLTKGHHVKIEMRLRGREKGYSQQGQAMVGQFIQDLGEGSQREGSISVQGGTISALVYKKS